MSNILKKVTQKSDREEAKYQELSSKDNADEATTTPQKTEVFPNSLIGQPTPRSLFLPFEKPSAAAVRKVAEAEIALLSQKLGAKAIAEIALDLCTLDDIKTIYADLRADLQVLEEEEG